MLRLVGTDAWRNWRAYDAAHPERETVVDDLQSDREFVGGPCRLGPYKLSVVIPTGPPGEPSVGSSVRLEFGIYEDLIPEVVVAGKLAKPDSDAYHGGLIGDEIAALVTLSLGVRLRCAGTSQTSGIHDSEQHEPIYFRVPLLLRPGGVNTEHIPAALSREADLGLLQRLTSFPTIDEGAQVELVRASRAYASALWWVNEDPNQAWLQLVTAAEIAANHRPTTSLPPTKLVEDLWPELWEALASGGEQTRIAVCKQVANQMRATRKFIDFIVQCAPDPVEPRPTFGAIEWDQMESHARIIYKQRSQALHGGKPFPMPMLQEARVEADGAATEGFSALNAGGLGGV